MTEVFFTGNNSCWWNKTECAIDLSCDHWYFMYKLLNVRRQNNNYVDLYECVAGRFCKEALVLSEPELNSYEEKLNYGNLPVPTELLFLSVL